MTPISKRSQHLHDASYKCPYAGLIKWHTPTWPLIQCCATGKIIPHVVVSWTAMRSDSFKCVAHDWTQCPTFQQIRGLYKGHNCFAHDRDGGVCMICGSVNHREAWRETFGEEYGR